MGEGDAAGLPQAMNGVHPNSPGFLFSQPSPVSPSRRSMGATQLGWWQCLTGVSIPLN